MSGPGANRLYTAAEYYAGTVGWKVFATAGLIGGRCDCGKSHPEPKDIGKHPRWGTSGFKDATADLAVLRQWWTENPYANIGVPCQMNGFMVVDVDPRNGGDESFDALESQIGGLPDTVQALTGEYTFGGRAVRGRHLYYRADQAESFKKEIKGLKGIDFKWPGYVLAAPSNHGSGQTYQWVPGKAPWEIPMADAPEELLAEIRSRKSRSASGSGGAFGVVEWDGEKLDIDAIVAAGIFEGERDNKLHKIACSMANDIDVSKGWMVASLKQGVHAVNKAACHPPLDEDDVNRICRQAIKLVEERPKTEMLWPGIEEYRGVVEAWKPSLPTPAESAGVVAGTVVEPPPAVPAAAVSVSGGAGSGGGGGEEGGIAGLSETDPSRLPKDQDNLREDEGGKVGDRSMSDTGNARRLIDYAGSRLRYSAGMGWFVWNDEYWAPDPGDLNVQEIAKRLPSWIASEIARADTPDKAEALLKWANRAKVRATRETAVKDARSDERILVPVSKWDSNPHVLGVKNGVIDLRSGRLDAGPGVRDLYITKQVQVAYTPGMTNVRWSEFLEFATGGDKELQRYMQLAAGYTLTGDRHHECMFMLYGPPGSGKSTFLDVLGTLLGSYRITFAADVLMDTGHGVRGSTEYYMAKLMGRRMLAISELPESVKMQEDAVKRLTGDTEISGRNPGGEPFEFVAQAKLWIGTNHRPRIQDTAMWRRIRAIHFNHVPEKPDPDLKPYLLDPSGALPAALAWAVEGAMMLLGSTDRQPLRSGACKAVEEATAEYMASENRIGIFLDEETTLVSGGSVNCHELWMIYQSWSEMRGEKPMTYIAFGRKLQEQGEKVDGRGKTMTVHDRAVTPRAVSSPGAATPWGELIAKSR